jgi:hypothetical protein
LPPRQQLPGARRHELPGRSREPQGGARGDGESTHGNGRSRAAVLLARQVLLLARGRMSVARLGRIEADPMGVPVAASMQLGLREPFAQHLDAMVAAAPARAPAAPAPPADRAEQRRARDDDAPHRDDDAAATAPAPTPADAAAAPADPSAPAALAAGCTQNPVKGEPARRIPDGEGADSPLTSPPRGEPALPAAAAAAATAPMGGAGAPALAGTAVGPAAAIARVDAGANAGANAGGGATPAAGPAAATTAKAAAAAAGYRTLTRQAVQLDEQAADSVFRQILFKLDKDRGEMRVHLEPPELGRLDLRLQVERNGDLRLSIGAERGDLAALLQKDLQPLVQALQLQGLHVVQAEVHAQARGDGNRGERAPDGAHGRPDRSRGDGGGDGDTAALPRIGTGYVTAQGLDFWA